MKGSSMKQNDSILYLECSMGAAGDMLSAALFELFPETERERILAELNAIRIPGVKFEAESSVKCGVTGTHMKVLVDGTEETVHDHEAGHHAHASLADIEEMIDGLSLSRSAAENAKAVYRRIASAESRVHGKSTGEVHFHEVGAMDAVADVTAVSYLMEKLAPAKVVVSPVRTGFGQVHCAHGILPVPAPATTLILSGEEGEKAALIYAGDIEGEMTTPTGAALLMHYADSFGTMPQMRVRSVGCGMGKKDFPAANCLRAFIGDAAGSVIAEDSELTDNIVLLACNLDDMTGEEIGFASQMLFEAGARDVTTTAIGMKKSRPGVKLEVLCAPEDEDNVMRAMFKHTTTLGIRRCPMQRYILDREIEEDATIIYKDVEEERHLRKKTSKGYGASHMKFEYDDLMDIAKNAGGTLIDIVSRHRK